MLDLAILIRSGHSPPAPWSKLLDNKDYAQALDCLMSLGWDDPEKALVDTLYLSTRKNRRFAKLPELDLAHSGFQQRKYRRLMQRLPIPTRILSAMNSRWDSISASDATLT